ncbi:MAG: putative ABC exporter domain-containing protein [Saccharofermentans sp.]|nr:putative ABC exporter domain-containing protein [Saccharofermentans sp.]
MLSATLYRFRRSLLKHPWKILIALLFIGMIFFMLLYPTLMAMPNSDGTPSDSIVPRNVEVVTGGLYFIEGVMFTFMCYTGIVGGVGGISLADVNFHLAGPFTKKFNLWLAAIGAFGTCIMIMFMISCQTAVIYSMLGVSTIDLIALWIECLASAFIGYFIGAWFGVKYVEDDKMKNICKVVLFAVMLVPVVIVVLPILMSGEKFSVANAVASFGQSMLTKFYPVWGWIGVIYDGIINGSIVYSIIGAVLLVATIAGLILLYNKSDLDYYESAMASAQKVADLREAKRAGIDADTARVNNKIKVGKETMGKGEGAFAFAATHLLMNKRASKFSFINPMALLYRIIIVIYMLFFMKTIAAEGDESLALITSLMMTLILNAVIYGGGKTVLEFSKPYIYLVPEKSSRKILACMASDIQEMIFDSIVCVGTFFFLIPNVTPAAAVALFFMMMVYDILCEIYALVVLRVCSTLGRYLLMIVRYIGIMIMVSIATIIGSVVMLLTSLTSAVITITVIGVILVLIMLIPASKVIENAEFNS